MQLFLLFNAGSSFHLLINQVSSLCVVGVVLCGAQVC